MSSPTLALALGFVAVAVAVAPGAAAAQEREPTARSLRWRLLDVEAHLDASGALHVRERQVLVLTGDWNGAERTFDVRRGQSLRLRRVFRVDGAGAHLLREGDLDAVDEWAWAPGADHRLRWRSRRASDPPFRETELTYVLEYVLAGVLVGDRDGRFRLAHDFAFADRPGPIEEVRARLTLDEGWDAGTAPLTLAGRSLPPGQGAVLTVGLAWVGAGAAPAPGRAAVGPLAPAWRLSLLAALALAFALAVRRVLRHARLRGLLHPEAPASAVDPAFVRAYVLAHPPAVIGAAWDGRVGAPEVSAVLARIAAEGKLEARADRGTFGVGRGLHLRLLVPRERLEGAERQLVEALFVEGDEIDSHRLREHYRRTGFDPSRRLAGVREAAEVLVPRERNRRRPLLPFVGLLAAAGLAGAWALAGGEEPGRVVVPFFFELPLLAFAVVAAARFAESVTELARRALPVVALVLAWAGIVAWLSGAAGARAAIAHALFWAAGLLLATEEARTRLTAQGVAARRRLVAARRALAEELRRPHPRIDDEWIPWLLAFGLGRGMDRWLRVHGPAAHSGGSGGATRGASPGGSPGWTGGGGQFSGGGATASWAALGAFAAGVSAPSSSSGSSSGSGSSGGGGGGGW